MALSVRTIEAERHREFNAAQPSVSFLQTPAWGQVKSEWRSESVGWFNGNDGPVGAGLVLYRKLPKIKKYLAYLPEGPVIDWTATDIGEWLRPLADHVRTAGAFALRIGATTIARRWSAGRSLSSGSRGSARQSPITSTTRRLAPGTGCVSSVGGRRRMRRVSPRASHGSSSSCRSPDVRPMNCSPG